MIEKIINSYNQVESARLLFLELLLVKLSIIPPRKSYAADFMKNVS